MPVALEQKYVTIKSDKTGQQEKVLILHPQFLKRVQFVLYQAPPIDSQDDAEVGEWAERLQFIDDDLKWLLQQPHDKFWCQVIHDDTLQRCIDSYLRYAPRPHDVVYAIADNLTELHASVHRRVFMVCLRMATHKETKDHFLTAPEFGRILYENFLFDVPKLMDLCVLYRDNNAPLLTKMITNIFTQQPGYWNDLTAVVPTIVQVFGSIAAKSGVRLDSMNDTPQRLESLPRRETLSNLPAHKLQDILIYLTDTAHTLHALLDIFPEAAKVFSEDFPTKLAAYYDALSPAFNEVFRSTNWKASPGLQQLLKDMFRGAQLALLKVRGAHDLVKGLSTEQLKYAFKLLVRDYRAVTWSQQHREDLADSRNKEKLTLFADLQVKKVFRAVVYQQCLMPILECSSADAVEEHVEAYLQSMSAILGEHRFLAHLDHLFPFAEDRDMLVQSPYIVLEFIQDAITEAQAAHSSKKRGRTPKGRLSPEMPGAEATTNSTAATESADGGAGARRLVGVELDSLITSVRDLLPDLGEGFIQLCLEEMGYDVERVINCVLEEKLPPSLQDADRSTPRSEKQVVETEVPTSILQERASVFDNDEFDLFNRDDVDQSRIHQGKAAKDKVVLGAGADTGVSREIYQKYGSEFTEGSMYDPQLDQYEEAYEDEYDDTYDLNIVGAADAEPEELLNKRPLLLPRLMGSGTHSGTQDEDDDEDQDGEGNPRRGDAFIEDPATIRARHEQRRISQASRGGRKGQGPPQGQRSRDVEGAPKGQGQSSEVLRNRLMKEKHKSTRVNHNRRALADKKRKV